MNEVVFAVNEFVDALLRLALLVAVVSALLHLRNYVRTDKAARGWELLRDAARVYILAAEQIGIETGGDKRQYVRSLLTETAVTRDIPISPAQLDALIEGVLKEIKRESTRQLLGEILQQGE
jgi:hypothetical protein